MMMGEFKHKTLRHHDDGRVYIGKRGRTYASAHSVCNARTQRSMYATALHMQQN